MIFHWPHAFWLLLVPAGFVIGELTRRARAVMARHPKIMRAEASPAGFTMAEEKSVATAMPRVRWRLWLGFMLAIVAFARPQWGEIEEPVFEQAREILIGIDLSRSMLAPDITPSRLDRSKLLITALLEKLEGERVGMAVFAGTAFLQSPLSADYEILREFLPALDPEFLPEGGTEYAALLDTALDAFSNDSNADRFLIILSDGESQTETWRDRINALRERSIRIISLGIGTADGAMLPDGAGGFVKDERGAVVLSRLNHSTLEELARQTEGIYRDASAWVDLAQVLQQTVEAGRAGDFSESRRARKIERFQWALGAGLLLLWWSLWREFPVRPRQRAVTVALSPSSARVTLFLSASLAFGLPAPEAANPGAPHSPAGPGAAWETPLSTLISQLAGRDEVQAPDFAELAEQTITWGNRVLEAGQTALLKSVIHDALDAVNVGELLDPASADWPTLREELEKLLEEAEQPEEQEQENEDEPEENEEEEKEEQEGQGEREGEPSPENERDEQEQEGSAEQEESSPSEQQRQNAENAFDEFEPPESEEPSPTEPPPPDPGQQEIGGQQVQNQEAMDHPELVVPLQKLDQLKDQDSPARLFQLMQDPAAQPPKSGRDW